MQSNSAWQQGKLFNDSNWTPSIDSLNRWFQFLMQLLHSNDMVPGIVLSIRRIRKCSSRSTCVRLWGVIDCPNEWVKRNSLYCDRNVGETFVVHFHRTSIEKFCGDPLNDSVYFHTLIIGLACIPTSFWLPLCVHKLGAKFFLGKDRNISPFQLT